MGIKILSTIKDNLIKLDDDFYEDIINSTKDEEYNSGIQKKEIDYYKALVTMAESNKDFNKEDIIRIFNKCYNEDNLKAIKYLFYIRDKEEGLGKRNFFKIICKYLGENNNKILRNNINNIPVYGRWDDLYSLFNTPLEEDVIVLIREQLKEDKKTDYPSTLGKWLKSENTSSKESKALAKRTRELLNMSPREYRLMLSSLREKLNIVERQMSNRDWQNIKYGNIPSAAMKKYSKAFYNRDRERFNEYLKISSINKKALKDKEERERELHPNDIVKDILKDSKENSTENLIKAWNNLEDYLEEGGDILPLIALKYNNINEIKVEDPYYINALSSCSYIIKNNKGAFKDYIITTTAPLNLKHIKTTDLKERLLEISKLSLCNTINVENILDVVLFAAIKHNLSKEDMPKRILCIVNKKTSISIVNSEELRTKSLLINDIEYESIKRKWSSSNYQVPEIIIWYLDEEKQLNSLINSGETIKFVFGYSPNIFKDILKNQEIKEEKGKETVIPWSRYDKIVEG